MYLPAFTSKVLYIPLIEQLSIVTMLAVTAIFFLVLLVLGIMKSRKLKEENERLFRKHPLSSEEDNKVYKDFTEGHLYDN